MESILNITLKNDQIVLTNQEQITPWYKNTPMIMHAGGAVREKDLVSYYTNSLEALTENYNLGERVFEFDFELTSDGKLALLHDWNQFSNTNAVVMSSEEWKSYKTTGIPITKYSYTSMLLEDLIKEMLVNKDIYIVTDTKISTDEAVIKQQFQQIYETAMKYDSEIINRFIPQIYNEAMYEYVMSVYDFPSIIYTTYSTADSSENIINFAIKHDNIQVITIPLYDSRFSDSDVQRIHSSNKILYTHTIRSSSEVYEHKGRGMDGFYSDLVLTSEIEYFNSHFE